MTGPSTYGAYLPAGSSTSTLTSVSFTEFTPGQTLYLSWYYSSTRTTGTNTDTINAAIKWYNASGTLISTTSNNISSNTSTSGYVFVEYPHVVPANAVSGVAIFTITPVTTIQHNIYIAKIRLGRTQVGATAGAIAGSNLTNSVGVVLQETDISNSSISLTQSGTSYSLNGAGPGSSVTFGGLGGGSVGRQNDLRFGGLYLKTSTGTVLNDIDVTNSAISLHQSGTSYSLNGAGPGSNITMSGLAGSTYRFATDTRDPSQLFNPAPNLLFNGGFRLYNNSLIPLGWGLGSDWYLTIAGGSEGPFIRTTSGGTSACVSDPFPCYSSQTYTLQGEMFAGGITAGGIFLDIQWYKDAAGTIPTTAGVSDGGPDVGAVNGTGWTAYSNQLVSPSDAVSGRVRVFVAASTNTNAAARRIKVSGYGVSTPFSDEATNSSRLLTTSGTGIGLGDGFQVPPVISAGGRYFYSSIPTAGSTTSSSSVLTLPAGILTVGGRTINYPLMTVSVTGSGTLTFFLYGDDINYSGTLVNGLQATTNTKIPYQGTGRIYFGSVQVTFTTGYTGGGGGGSGGGWDVNNF